MTALSLPIPPEWFLEKLFGSGGPLKIENETGGRYTLNELQQLVAVASADLSFKRHVLIRITCEPPWSWKFGRLGFTKRLPHRTGECESVLVRLRVPPNREYVSPPSETWYSPGLEKRLRRRGYLDRPEMRGVEVPLYVAAHEMCHAANVKFPVYRWSSLRVQYEAEADAHALKVLEEVRSNPQIHPENVVSNP